MTAQEMAHILIHNKTDSEIIHTPLILKNISTEKYDGVANEFKCGECNELVYKKEMYQCKNGDLFCKECFRKQIELNHDCKTCKVSISSMDELSRCKFYENSFSNKKINCPYSLSSSYSIADESETVLTKDSDGCGEIIKISELENHMVNCEKRFVCCKSVGCDQILRSNNLQLHIDSCGFAIISCQHCNVEVIRSKLEEHFVECPSIEIECHQCQLKVKRGLLGEHIRVTCDKTKISCRYSDHGCMFEFERNQLDSHLENVNHTKYITSFIEKQQEEIQKLISLNLMLSSTIDNLKLNEENQRLQIEQFNQSLPVFENKKSNDQNVFNGYWFLNDYSKNLSFNSGIYKLNDGIEFSFTASNHNFSMVIANNPSSMNFIAKFTIINSKNENNKKLTKQREFKEGFKRYFLFPFLKSSYNNENGFTDEDRLVIKFSVSFYEEIIVTNNNNDQ